MKNLVIGIQEKPENVLQWILLSLQHVFAMFGATVLVPILTGLDVGVALVASGLGTLIYIGITKGKVPVYLGSSFAYIAAISLFKESGDYTGAFLGLILVGIVYVIVALVIKYVGSGWLKKLLPPVVIGPMIMIIGLGLAGVATGQSGISPAFYAGDEYLTGLFVGWGWKAPVVALVTFLTVVFVGLKGKGFFRIVPFLIAIVVGYVLSVILGVVDLRSAFEGVRLFNLPDFTIFGTYETWDFTALIIFAPIAFVTIAEHIGDHTVLGEICEEDFITDPGLDKTLMGDGIATAVSAMLGGPANTTYGENTGVVAMTKVGSVYVTGLAAIIAVSLGFLGPIQAFVNSIPMPVMGGIAMVLFGLIASNGVKVLIKEKVNLGNMRNLIIVATMLVIGIGGASFTINEAVSLQGMSLAAVVGVVLNLILPKIDEPETVE